MMAKNTYKVDLHTHSTLSHDGGIKLAEYEQILSSGILDAVAITDHNEIDSALELHEKLGARVIVGEEIMTKQGEIIGLFLERKISAKLDISTTIEEIKAQGGLVYIPHPMDLRRSGVSRRTLEQVLPQIDIFEVFNARNIFPGANRAARDFAEEKNIAARAVASDSHSRSEIGRTYNVLSELPHPENLVAQLQMQNITTDAKTKYVNAYGFTAPKRNKFAKLINKYIVRTQ